MMKNDVENEWDEKTRCKPRKENTLKIKRNNKTYSPKIMLQKRCNTKTHNPKIMLERKFKFNPCQ
jgi:hypothetical protein